MVNIKNLNKKRLVKYAVVSGVVVGMMAVLSACRKKEEPIEIDRTFEYTTQETTTRKETQKETQKETEKKTERETETTTQKETESTSETTAEGAAGYFKNKNSIFNTLPEFEAGKYVDYFDKMYMEGLEFSGVKKTDFEAYYDAVVKAGKYKLNSQDSNRYYLENEKKDMCITLIYHEGTVLIEAGKNYWDVITFAQQEAVTPTKPANTTDERYGYFDDKNSTLSSVPYFTYGKFESCESIDNGTVITFSDITDSNYSEYGNILSSNGYMFSGNVGNDTYYTSDTIIVTVNYSNGNLTIKAIKNQY